MGPETHKTVRYLEIWGCAAAGRKANTTPRAPGHGGLSSCKLSHPRNILTHHIRRFSFAEFQTFCQAEQGCFSWLKSWGNRGTGSKSGARVRSWVSCTVSPALVLLVCAASPPKMMLSTTQGVTEPHYCSDKQLGQIPSLHLHFWGCPGAAQSTLSVSAQQIKPFLHLTPGSTSCFEARRR